MSEPAPRRRGLLVLLVLACAAVVAALIWSPEAGSPSEDGAAGQLPQPKSPLGAEVRSAEISGRLWVEGPIPDDDPLADPPLSPATQCTVRVWKAGEEVGSPAQCGADGHYVVTLQAGVFGRVSVELESAGRLRAVVTVDVAEGGEGVLPDVAVGHGATVRGQVVDLRGEPLAGVRIEARPNPDLGEPEPWRRVTADDGTFSFDTLPPGPVTLRCAPPGHAPTVVEAIAPQAEVIVRLGGLYDVRGRVLAAGTDADVAAATVRLEGSGVWPARVVEVGPDGSFEVPGVPDGVYALEAVVDGDDGPSFASLPLEGVEPDMEVSLALLPAHWVPVVVEDPSGAKVSDARVTLMNAQVGLLSKVARTDAQGEARLGPVVPGAYVARADGDGWLASAPEAVQVEDADPDPVVLHLERPGTLVVTVLDPSGRAVPDARVGLRSDALYSVGESEARAETFERVLRAAGTLGVMPGPVPPVPTGDDGGASAWRRTGARGAVTFGDLVPGGYTVTAAHPGFAASAERSTSLRAGGRVELSLVLRDGQPLTGRVRDGNDRPVGGAQVRVDGVLVARTDDRGVFDAGPHAGDVEVSVRAEGFATATERVRMGDAPVDLELALVEADGVLEGQVLGGNERPVEGARVSVHPRGGRSRTTWTDASGAFAFEGLPRGRAEVTAEHEDYVASSTGVTVDADASVSLTLREGWRTTVVVRWSGTLQPVQGARVRGGGSTVAVDEDGDAVLSGLSRDTVRVEVSAAGAPTVRRTLRRAKASDQEVFIELVEGGNLAGRVTDYRGDPVPRARVEVRVPGAETPLATTRAGSRGKYRFEGLPEGDVEVQAWPSEARDEDLDTEVLRSDVRRGHVTSDVVFKLPRL